MKRIPLTQGHVAVVDDEDFERVSQHKWNAQRNRRTWYAVRTTKGRPHRFVHMHRYILGIEDSAALADHIDGNGLNNRRRNLRVATKSQNQLNQRTPSNNTTGFKGVVLRGKRYRAQMKFNKQYFSLGTFEKAEDAARAYDKKAKELGGEFAWLNFPEEIANER